MELSLLIACADAATSDIYRRLFSSCGYAVETASGGLECLTKLRDVAPDILILDAALRWGGADGVLARMREEELSIANIPVVLIISDEQLHREDPDLASPPIVWRLRKPFRLSALFEAVSFASDCHRQGSMG